MRTHCSSVVCVDHCTCISVCFCSFLSVTAKAELLPGSCSFQDSICDYMSDPDFLSWTLNPSGEFQQHVNECIYLWIIWCQGHHQMSGWSQCLSFYGSVATSINLLEKTNKHKKCNLYTQCLLYTSFVMNMFLISELNFTSVYFWMAKCYHSASVLIS